MQGRSWFRFCCRDKFHNGYAGQMDSCNPFACKARFCNEPQSCMAQLFHAGAWHGKIIAAAVGCLCSKRLCVSAGSLSFTDSEASEPDLLPSLRDSPQFKRSMRMIEAEKVSTYCPSRQRRDLIPSAGLHPGAESFELQGQLSSIPGQRSNDYPVSNIPFQIRRRPQGSLVEGMGGVRCFKLVDRTIAPAQVDIGNHEIPRAEDKTARPNLDLGRPVDVGVQLYLAAIPEVDQKKQQFVIEGYFRLDWTDNRLATTGDPCASTMILEVPVPSVWQPDIYWDNSLAEWYGTGAMNIYEDGRIYRSVRYKQTLRCPMNFQRLPFDKQRCFALLGSYSWDLHNVNASAFSNGAVVVPEGYDGTTEWQLEEATYEVTTEWFGAGEDRKGYKYIWVYFNLNRRPNSFLMFVVGRGYEPGSRQEASLSSLPGPACSSIGRPELNYLTWLTSFLFVMKLFGLSCVFEYGLVWLLLQVEGERDRQFEALTQMSTIINKRSADQEGAIAEPEFHNTEPLFCLTRLHRL
eukprot:s2129_g16.t1